METFTTELLEQMKDAIRQVNKSDSNVLQKTEQCCYICKDFLQQLKTFILAYTFKDTSEEIRFFKEMKPQFLKELIYYSELNYLETHKPVSSVDLQLQHYMQEMERIRMFFERHKHLYVYNATGKTGQDEIFFLRQSAYSEPAAEHFSEMDPQFCTVASYRLSKLLGYEQVRSYLLKCLDPGRGSTEEPDIAPDLAPPHVTWTDSKVYLIEVAYSLFASGSIDNGKASIKDIIAAVEYIFNIDLGNYSSVFNQNIRLRKKDRLIYLPLASGNMEKYMDDLDENPARR